MWYDHTDYDSSGTDVDIFYKYWNTATAIWTTTEVISTESTVASSYPNIAIDSHDNLHVVWSDYTDYDSFGVTVYAEILYKYWNAATAIWTTTEEVPTSPGESYHPNIAIDSHDNPHVVWIDYTDYDRSGGDADIFYKYWNATTATSSNMTIYSQITLDIAWYDIIIGVVVITTIIVSIVVLNLLINRNKKKKLS